MLDGTIRLNTFGSTSPPLKALNTDPERVLARATLGYAFGTEVSTKTTTATTAAGGQVNSSYTSAVRVFVGNTLIALTW